MWFEFGFVCVEFVFEFVMVVWHTGGDWLEKGREVELLNSFLGLIEMDYLSEMVGIKFYLISLFLFISVLL